MIITKQVKLRDLLVDVKALKPYTMKRVIVKCPFCLKVREAYYRSVRNDQTCHACANGIKNSKPIPEGSVFGRLTVLSAIKFTESLCQCECGNTSIVRNDSLVSGHTRSCGCLRSENALRIGRKTIIKWRRNGHPNWKGGITSERRRFNASKKAKVWRTSVFERDNYSCQICGQRGGTLNAHHVKQYATHPDLRLDVDNGITLCEECHRQEHKRIRKKQIWSSHE